MLVDRLSQLPEELLHPVFAVATSQDLFGVLALAAACRHAQLQVWTWLGAQRKLITMIGAHSPARVWRLASVVRRMLGDKLESIFVGHSQYSFNAERTDHDKPLVLYDSPIPEAQQLLSLVELSSPRNYNGGRLVDINFYERHLGDVGLETVLGALASSFELASLHRIGFQACWLTSQGAGRLATFLGRHGAKMHNLRYVCVSRNGLVRAGAKAALSRAVNKLNAELHGGECFIEVHLDLAPSVQARGAW